MRTHPCKGCLVKCVAKLIPETKMKPPAQRTLSRHNAVESQAVPADGLNIEETSG